jgi:hypothetical protein
MDRTLSQIIPRSGPDSADGKSLAKLTAWSMDGIHDLILRDRGLGDILPTLVVLVAYGSLCAASGSGLYRFRA